MRRALLGGAAASILILCPIGLPAQTSTSTTAPTTKPWVLKLAAPWPDADRLTARRVAAENRALFQSNEPILLTLAADFKTVNKDRTVNSPHRYPGKLS